MAHLSQAGATCQKCLGHFALTARECYFINSFLCPEHKKDNHKWTSDTLWKFSLAMNHLRWRCFVSLARALPSSPESMPVLKGAPTKSFSEWSLNHQASSKPGITSSHVDVQIFSPFVEVFSLALSQVVSIGYLYFELYWKEDYTRTFHFS